MLEANTCSTYTDLAKWKPPDPESPKCRRLTPRPNQEWFKKLGKFRLANRKLSTGEAANGIQIFKCHMEECLDVCLVKQN